MNIKPLDEKLIQQANNNSFGGKRGDMEASSYESYCKEIISWNLSEHKTEQLLDKVYKRFSKALSLDAQHVSVAVAGGSNYNEKKLDKSDAILQNATDFVEWFAEIKEQATAKKKSRISWLIKEIIWGVSDGYNVNSKWKELAARSLGDFEILYEELYAKYHFKQSSVPYKIYNKFIEIEPITQTPVYADDDFKAYIEEGKICIDFRMKPQRQLIVALKSKGFMWVAAHNLWKANSTLDRIEWVKTISERYKDYI